MFLKREKICFIKSLINRVTSGEKGGNISMNVLCR